MFEDTLELAENKLLLLYIFSKIKLPISNTQITQIILENNFINYFILQQYISELIESNFLSHVDDANNHKIIITEKGTKVLSLFLNRVSESKLEAADKYLKKHMDKIKNEVNVAADYTIEKENNFIVNLKASENDLLLIDIKINVPSNKQARDLCSKWKKNPSEIYNKIIGVLIDD